MKNQKAKIHNHLILQAHNLLVQNQDKSKKLSKDEQDLHNLLDQELAKIENSKSDLAQ